MIDIRPATPQDREAMWSILEPVIRAGETYALARDMTKAEALAYWHAADKETWVALSCGRVVGTYYLRANQAGGGDHVANCGFVTAPDAGGRGIARAMCEHALGRARERGFRAMQFNFVIASNERAVRLWTSLGFATVGRIPCAFRHPRLGDVDALVMHRMV